MTLEKILNTLCEKGRVPFGDGGIHSFEIIYVTGEIRSIVAKRGRGQVNGHYSIRDLVSKSSGLWQFVCENRMVRKKMCYCTIRTDSYVLHKYYKYNYEYRLIESALKDKDELEQFLLQSIVIDNE